MPRLLLTPALLLLLLLPAAAGANDVVRITSEPSTTRVWPFAPTPEQLLGMTEMEIVFDGETRLVHRSDFLESLQTRGLAYVSWVGTVEDPDHPPMVIRTYPPATAELLIHRDNTRFCPGADEQPTADNLPTVQWATLCLINLERTQRGIAPFRVHPQLQKASQDFAEHMVKLRFFDHIDPMGVDLGDRLRKVGYFQENNYNMTDITLGENIAAGPEWGGKPRYIVPAWMQSEGHRANMLDPLFVEIGVGIAPATTRGTPGGTYVTDFGQRWFRNKTKPKPKPCKTKGKAKSCCKQTKRAKKCRTPRR